jgi:hypothetical protein
VAASWQEDAERLPPILRAMVLVDYNHVHLGVSNIGEELLEGRAI